MGKYIAKRLLYGALSAVAVVAIVMVMIYSMLDRMQIFASDPSFSRQTSNTRETYCYAKWEQYGYLDYVTYQDWLTELVQKGELDEATRDKVASIARKEASESPEVAEYTAKFREYYESRGYTVTRLDAQMNGKRLVSGGQQALFAAKDKSLAERIWKYFTGLIFIDNIHNTPEVQGSGA